MTTVVTRRNGTTVPFDVALEDAKRAYLNLQKRDISKMSTKELEERRAIVREYYALSRIARMTDARGVEYADRREYR